MKFYKILFFSALFCIAFHLHAEHYEYRGDCTSKKFKYKLNECLIEELSRYDKELNNLYKNYLKHLPNKKLKKVELLWIHYKEEDCDYIASEVNRGTEYRYIYMACLISKTKVRIAELKRPLVYSEWFKRDIITPIE